MGQARRDYGCQSRTVLQVASAAGYCTQESFAAFIEARTGDRLHRTQVTHWAAGTCHLPADALLLLFEHVAHPDQVQHLVQVWLAGLTFDGRAPVVSMEPVDQPGGDLVHEVLDLGAALGRLQARVSEALHPRGSGGARITREERATALDEARTLSRAVLHLIADLEE